jgi:hypothetical protein
MGRKLQVSLAMEGKLSNEGLQSVDEDDDVLTAMARELVMRQGIGEAAAEVWKSLLVERSVPSEVPQNHTDSVSVPNDPAPWTQPMEPGVQLSLF